MMPSWSATPSVMHHQSSQPNSYNTSQQQNLIIINPQQTNNNNNNNHSSNVASFVARLMSLNAHELQCLHADAELMRQLTETHLLMENKLQIIQNKLLIQQQQNNYYQECYQQALSAHYNQQQQQLQQQQQHQQQQHQQQQQQMQQNPQSNPQLALDLRLSGVQAQHQQMLTNNQRQRHPKKLKLDEYQQQLVICELSRDSNSSRSSSSSSSASPNSHLDHKLLLAPDEQPIATPDQTSSKGTPATKVSAKKYKGEFDEPTPEEVERRQRILSRSDNYHRAISSAHLPAECACVLGSQFRDHKSTSSVLTMIDRWRHLDTEERIKTKWDVTDLPLDIPLADIKKFEDLRREASHGRADFGGASKRKPLGIRATRQFLLILYCLWGHPGRDDVMQKEGYCPHCFAKIKKSNEQSTLVRVVNHFNMKHRRGANPRLSPHTSDNTSPSSSDNKSSVSKTVSANNNLSPVSPNSASTVLTDCNNKHTELAHMAQSSISLTNTSNSTQQHPASLADAQNSSSTKQLQHNRPLFADLLLLANSSSRSPTSTTPPSPEPPKARAETQVT